MRRLRILFLSVCATLVAVGFWVVAVLLNLLHWVLGDSPSLRPYLWVLVCLSAVAFFAVFYRHFSREVAREALGD